MTTRTFFLLCVMLAARALAVEKAEPALDPATGMKMAENWEVVRNHCVICHSPRTFLQQRGTEATWRAVLRWMQTSGGLWKLDPSVEKNIIGYLAGNYGPDRAFRRAPIPATLMPRNPYASAAKREAEAKREQGLLPPVPRIVR